MLSYNEYYVLRRCLVRSEGGADCLKLQEANGGSSGGEGGILKSEKMEGVVGAVAL